MYATRALRAFRPSPRMMRAVPNEGAKPSFFARLRKVPPELFPLGIVVGFAVSAAGYSSLRHFLVDKNIRLKRQNRAADNAAAHHGEAGHEEAAPAAEAEE